MNNRLKICDQNGSLTSEAAIVFPTVLFSCILVAFLSVIMYSRVYIKNIAQTAAQKGSTVWEGMYFNCEDAGIIPFTPGSQKLYRRIYDPFYEERINALREYIGIKLDSFRLLEEISRSIDIRLQDNIINKKLYIDIEIYFKNPAEAVTGIFGLKDIVVVENAVAAVDEPAESIRNIDFAIDLEKDMEKRFPELKNAADKLRGLVTDIKENLNSFFKE